MAAPTKYAGSPMASSNWDDALEQLSLPLLGTGNNRVEYNSADETWDFYIGGNKVARLRSNGDLEIEGSVRVRQSL